MNQFQEALQLLVDLIRIPSFSGEEMKAADHIADFLTKKEIRTERYGYNVLAKNLYFSEEKPTLLLNSHLDTVKPNSAYTRDPFDGLINDEKLYGLGSNDAGGCLVSLCMAFVHFHKIDLPFNLVFAATAEEENSGKNGLESVLPMINPNMAIIGEPTKMDVAVAERGLMVLDGTSKGKAGHAARNEGENAIYKAMRDIEWLSTYKGEKSSQWLGDLQMSVTQIQAGSQHNVVPAECSFVVDIRLNECYSFQETLDTIQQHTSSEYHPRSMRLRPSGISIDHPIVQAALRTGAKAYGSPTTSDLALLNCPGIKMGPGDSARSHMADEFIYLSDLEKGIEGYIGVIHELKKELNQHQTTTTHETVG